MQIRHRQVALMKLHREQECIASSKFNADQFTPDKTHLTKSDIRDIGIAQVAMTKLAIEKHRIGSWRGELGTAPIAVFKYASVIGRGGGCLGAEMCAGNGGVGCHERYKRKNSMKSNVIEYTTS